MTRRRRRAQRPTLPLGGSAGWAPGRLIGTVVDDRFRLDELLGSGGMGEVYEAVDLAAGTSVAIKVLLPALRSFPAAVRRFQREARAGGLLDHPNIVDVTETGTLADGSLYLVMELVEGDDLTVLIEQGALTEARAIAIADQALQGLAHAHSRGVVHRDLKPANVMIVAGSGGDVVKVLDFGLAKLFGHALSEGGTATLTETGAVFGTAAYMGPEQALGRPATLETDLYSMGVILFEMLTGKQPFRGPDPHATMRQHIHAAIPEAPGCSAELNAVIRRALEKSRKARFASADEMRAALAHAARSHADDSRR